MRIQRLHLRDYRGIENLELQFSDTPVIVLVGANGAGKTSILDCLALLLSRLGGAIRRDTSAGGKLSEYDIKNERPMTRCEITLGGEFESTTWALVKSRPGRAAKERETSDLAALKTLAETFQARLQKSEPTNLPLFAYYPVNRAALDIPLRTTRRRRAFDSLSAYEGALGGGERNFRVFFEWFRNQEDIENERRLKSRGHRDRTLEAVRTAIYRLMPEFSALRVERSPRLRMMVKKRLDNGAQSRLSVNQLSDGEKCLLALIGDLARRLALANPGLTDPLQGVGVVLIDEVELHLYPGWQRRVLSDLHATFPRCQFIISTHSALVLSHVQKEGVFLLRQQGGRIVVEKPESSYGMEVTRLLEDVMGVEGRPAEIKQGIERLYELIHDARWAEARALRAELEAKLSTAYDPDLVGADALLLRMQVVGR